MNELNCILKTKIVTILIGVKKKKQKFKPQKAAPQ